MHVCIYNIIFSNNGTVAKARRNTHLRFKNELPCSPHETSDQGSSWFMIRFMIRHDSYKHCKTENHTTFVLLNELLAASTRLLLKARTTTEKLKFFIVAPIMLRCTDPHVIKCISLNGIANSQVNVFDKQYGLNAAIMLTINIVMISNYLPTIESVARRSWRHSYGECVRLCCVFHAYCC